MPRRRQLIYLFLFTLFAACLSAQSPVPVDAVPDLTGEWAVEWADSKKDETEIVYIWFTQKDGVLGGTALDPNLIPAAISGRIRDLKVTFEVDPQDGNGWAAAPTSTFKGRMTDSNTMVGRWTLSLLERGSWKAWRTSSVTPSVTVTAKTVVAVRFSSEEYALLTHDYRETRRVGDEIEILSPIGGLGWLYRYCLVEDFIRINPSSPDAMIRRQIQGKILVALNESGYPWKKIPR